MKKLGKYQISLFCSTNLLTLWRSIRRNGLQPAQQRLIHFNQECKDPLVSIFVKYLTLQLILYLQILAKRAGRELLMKTLITSVFVRSDCAKCAKSCLFSTRLKNAKNPKWSFTSYLGLNTFKLQGNTERSRKLFKNYSGESVHCQPSRRLLEFSPFSQFPLARMPHWPFTWSYVVRSVQNERCQQLWVLGSLSVFFTLSNYSGLSTMCRTAFISIKTAFFPLPKLLKI